MTVVAFDVLGTPMPQGSKKAFNANGRAMMKEAGGLNHAAWRNAVASSARDRAETCGTLTGPLYVRIEFRFPMPQSRTKAQHALEQIRKTTAPDIDKLQRAVYDGLQAGALIANDSLICGAQAYKYEVTGWIGARITIDRLPEP